MIEDTVTTENILDLLFHNLDKTVNIEVLDNDN